MRFAAHQTFHIREGWLYKGMAAVCNSSTIFMEPDASEQLGLGKNMVRSLRFWMQSSGLTEECIENQRTVQILTEPFGQLVWEYDKYQEEDGTLWLIHYHIVRDINNTTAWHWFFNHFSQPVFNAEGFLSALQSWAIGNGAKSASEKLLKRDFDCLIHTYLPDVQAHSPEDLLECPLAQLGLLVELDNSNMRRFRLLRPEPSRVHPLVFLYVLLSWQQANRPEARQVGLDQVLSEPNSVGRVFNLNTTGLSNCLSRLRDEYPDLAVGLTRTAGLDQLTLPQVSANRVLIRYFETRS